MSEPNRRPTGGASSTESVGEIASRGSVKTKAQEVTDYLRGEVVYPKFAEACRGVIDPDKLINIVGSLLNSDRGASLRGCETQSFYTALIDALTVGVVPVMGRAYLVPRGTKCTYMLGYQGMIDLAVRAGLLVRAETVMEDDQFEWEQGLEPRLFHKPSLGGRTDDTKMKAAYCVTEFPPVGGQPRRMITVMSRAEIEAARDSTRNPKYGLPPTWKNHYLEMAKKTVLRRAAKFWPLSADAALIVQRDDDMFGCEAARAISGSRSFGRSRRTVSEAEAKEKLREVFQAPKEEEPDPEPDDSDDSFWDER